MSNLKSKMAVALALVILVAYVASVRAVEYNVGVKVGDWVKYGDFVGIGTGTGDANKTDWGKYEVVAVSGKEVTLHGSGKYKNGSDLEETGTKVNVETGMVNGTMPTYGLGPVIAKDLKKDDAFASGSAMKVNKTESRSYMGVSRTVNIYNYTMSAPGATIKYIMVWDQASGILLETDMSSTLPVTGTWKMSYKAIDTNIFTTGAAGWLMDNIIYIVIAVIVIIIIVVVVAMMMRKKPPPPPAPEAKETTTAPET